MQRVAQKSQLVARLRPVRFRLVNMLETTVSSRFPTECQKNSTRRGPP